MLRSTTIERVETRNHSCQSVESILVMSSTPMKRVAIRERAPISLGNEQTYNKLLLIIPIDRFNQS